MSSLEQLGARVYLRRRSHGYTAIFYDPDRHPKQKYVTLKTRDQTVARRKLTELERRYALGKYDPWSQPVPREGVFLQEAINGYLGTRSHVRPRSRRADSSTLHLFDGSLAPGMLVGNIERRHVEAFLDKKLSAATLCTYHARLKGFFKWCVGEGIAKHNPVDGVARPKIPRKEKRFLTKSQYERLLRTIESDASLKAAALKAGEILWLADVVRFAVGTGLRLGEITALRWGAVDLETRAVRVETSEDFVTKSGHERLVPVEGDALAVLERLNEARATEAEDYVFGVKDSAGRRRRRLNDTYVSKRFLQYARLSELPTGVSFHTLRHTYISWLIMAGTPVPVAQKLAGHADIKTTMGYAHLAPESLRRAVENVFGPAAA